MNKDIFIVRIPRIQPLPFEPDSILNNVGAPTGQPIMCFKDDIDQTRYDRWKRLCALERPARFKKKPTSNAHTTKKV